MTTYLFIRDNQVKLRLPNASVQSDGRIAVQTTNGVDYVVNGEFADQDGQLAEIQAHVNACNWGAIDDKYFARLGDNPAGLRVLTSQQWHAEETALLTAMHAEQRDAEHCAIEGLEELRAAIADQARYDDEFTAMMEDGDNDGICFPRKPTADAGALKRQHQRAAAYVKAESWSRSSHYVQAAAGKRAMERLVAGDDIAKVVAEMRSEWSDHCRQHAWD